MRHAIALTLLLCGPSLAAPLYTITDLGSTTKGQLVWDDPSLRALDFQSSNGPDRSITAQTDAAQVGAELPPSGNNTIGIHAYIHYFSQPAIYRDLGTLVTLSNGAPANSFAVGLSPGLLIAGNYVTGFAATDNSIDSPVSLSCCVDHAFLWQPSGGLMDLGTLSGDTGLNSVGSGVNDWGEVVGYSQIYTTPTGNQGPMLVSRAFLLTGRSSTSIGTLYNLTFFTGQNVTNIKLTNALAINCQGNIAAVGIDLRDPVPPDQVSPQHQYLLTRVGPPRVCP
jgi:hypothetical protein